MRERHRAVLGDDAARAADAGAVHQNARHAVLRGRALQCGDGGGFVGHVAVLGMAADLGGDGAGEVHVHVEDGHLGAGGGQFHRGAFAEAGGAAGDECCMSFGIHLSVPYCV